MDVDRDQLVHHVTAIAEALGDVEALRKARDAEYSAKRAEIDLLIADRRVVVTHDGLLQYQLTKPIELAGKQMIETITFRKPTVGTVRHAARYIGDEWAAYLIRELSREIPDDDTLNKIDASEWDDIVRVARFPFAHPPSRGGGQGSGPPTSGGPS